MPEFVVTTPQRTYPVIVERGAISAASDYLPEKAGKVFVVTTKDVWQHHGAALETSLRGRDWQKILFTGGEDNKRLAHVERMAVEMVESGADRSSLVIAFGGGIVNDLGGFLAAIFMRGIPVMQIPTTLLAQVDAAVGGKTGANLVLGKNLVGSFHQPLAVLIDPAVLETLPEREYRAGLYEIIKHGVIADAALFKFLEEQRDRVFRRESEAVNRIIEDSVRLKAEVVSGDERETGRRKILNFGHTFGHALEAETRYTRFLHGEAVSWGMRAAVHLASMLELIDDGSFRRILAMLDAYGPIPSLEGVSAEALQGHLVKDKKTIQNRIHFVLPTSVGTVIVHSGASPEAVHESIIRALKECQ